MMEQVPSAWYLLFNDSGASTQFYTVSSDIISLLFMFNSFLRMVIYFLCNPEIRKELRTFYTCWQSGDSQPNTEYVLRVA